MSMCRMLSLVCTWCVDQLKVKTACETVTLLKIKSSRAGLDWSRGVCVLGGRGGGGKHIHVCVFVCICVCVCDMCV